MSGNTKNDVAVLACYEKERAARRVQKSARMLRKRAWRGVSRRVLACYEKERVEVCPEECSHVMKKSWRGRVQKSARMLRKSSRPGRTRAVGRQSTGADTDTGSRKAVDRGGHGQSEAVVQSTGADTRPVLWRRRRFLRRRRLGCFQPWALAPRDINRVDPR